MNNKSGARALASMAGIAAAGILMAPAAWAAFVTTRGTALLQAQVLRAIRFTAETPASALATQTFGESAR